VLETNKVACPLHRLSQKERGVGLSMVSPEFGIHCPWDGEPDFGATSVNYDLNDLIAKAEEPG